LTAPAPPPNDHALATTKELGKVHAGCNLPNSSLTMKEQKVLSANFDPPESGSGCAGNAAFRMVSQELPPPCGFG
jgi:hypothetical protein